MDKEELNKAVKEEIKKRNTIAGALGGKATSKKGSTHFKELQKKSVESRMRNKCG